MNDTYKESHSGSRLKPIVHYLVPAILSLVFTFFALYRLYLFQVDDLDYSLFSNIIWNFSQGNGWQASLYIGSVRYNFLADHIALTIPLLAPIFYLFPYPGTLTVIHGLAFSATFFLVPVLTREIWNEYKRDDYLYAALFLLLALSVFKGFTAAWRYQTHMSTLIMPCILCALIALHRKALWWALFWSILVALAQERAAVAVFGIGMYAIGITGQRRFGLTLCALSTIYFVAIVRIFIPSFYQNSTGYLYNSNIQPFSDLKQKCLFIINSALYWLFLPLAGRNACIAAACSLPVLSLGLISNRPSMYTFSQHYQDMPSMFLAAAAAHGLLWLAQQHWYRKIPQYTITLLAVIFIIFSTNYSNHSTPFLQLRHLEYTEAVRNLNKEITTHKDIPKHIAVFTTGGLGPRLPLREKRYVIKPDRASQPFSESLIFVTSKAIKSPVLPEKIISVLDRNESVTLIKRTAELSIYASKDLQHFSIGQ